MNWLIKKMDAHYVFRQRIGFTNVKVDRRGGKKIHSYNDMDRMWNGSNSSRMVIWLQLMFYLCLESIGWWQMDSLHYGYVKYVLFSMIVYHMFIYYFIKKRFNMLNRIWLYDMKNGFIISNVFISGRQTWKIENIKTDSDS